jgi:E3 ubiquitin-protein ligase DOA10
LQPQQIQKAKNNLSVHKNLINAGSNSTSRVATAQANIQKYQNSTHYKEVEVSENNTGSRGSIQYQQQHQLIQSSSNGNSTQKITSTGQPIIMQATIEKA